MVENVTMIDAVFNQISLKFKLILSHFQTSKPKNFSNSDPKLLLILIYHTCGDIFQLHNKIFTIAWTKMLKYAIFLSKSAIFCVFAVFKHFNFSRLPPQFEKVTEAFELEFGLNMPCRMFYKRCAAFFEKKNFDHFLAKNVSFLAIFA